jgi:hypothetical protein
MKQTHESILRNWNSYMLHRPHEEKYGKLGWHFIRQYSQMEKEEYLKRLVNICTSTALYPNAYKDVLCFAKEVMWLGSDGILHRFHESLFDLLPSIILSQYTATVSSIDESLLTKEEKNIRTQFLENIAKIG